MKRISLTQNKSVIVDDDTFIWLSKHKCFACAHKGRYAGFCEKVNGKWKTILIHRRIMRAREGQIVDHINRNPLDCRMKNLRIVSCRQNILNGGSVERRSIGKRGTYFDMRSKNWIARVRIGDKKRIHLGSFRTQKEASLMYDKAFKQHSK